MMMLKNYDKYFVLLFKLIEIFLNDTMHVLTDGHFPVTARAFLYYHQNLHDTIKN